MFKKNVRNIEKERIKFLNKDIDIKFLKDRDVKIDYKDLLQKIDIYFEKIDLRVGEIKECKKVEKSDKLLVSQVEIGTEIRQIVSGIAESYNPDELIGKKVLVVVNLNPAKIRGVESKGMLLCASDGKTIKLVEVPESNSGVKVK